MHLAALSRARVGGGRARRFLRSPCKSLKTLGWLCIKFYAQVPVSRVGQALITQRLVSIGLRLTFQVRCTADFPHVSRFLPTTGRVAPQTRFRQAGRINSKRVCISQLPYYGFE